MPTPMNESAASVKMAAGMPNVIETTPAQAQPAPQQAPGGYSQLAILAPEEQGTVHTNTGAFAVQVALAPGLDSGDAFVVTLDGSALPGRYRSADIAITEET